MVWALERAPISATSLTPALSASSSEAEVVMSERESSLTLERPFSPANVPFGRGDLDKEPARLDSKPLDVGDEVGRGRGERVGMGGRLGRGNR